MELARLATVAAELQRLRIRLYAGDSEAPLQRLAIAAGVAVPKDKQWFRTEFTLQVVAGKRSAKGQVWARNAEPAHFVCPCPGWHRAVLVGGGIDRSACHSPIITGYAAICAVN